MEVLTFDLGGETFALEATLVREILDLLPETCVPGAPALVSHVVNFRGRIVPVADLRLAFGMDVTEATPDSRIVVIELPLDGEPTLIGLRTDHVYEVATLSAESSEEAPVVGMRWQRDFVRRLVRRRDDLIVLPDLHTIFAPALSGGSHS
ncbi:MAG: chemotaxis protein CheW [Sphingomonas phyllosphaerae]|uniref:chemotaxis protein CheW n=1 Tax=Sphingomonas phyllosphaerae TaxID=257003 RepID=UPI002FFA316B